MSYSINGIPACANKKLLTDIAREEWNFTGYIVSDQGAIGKMGSHIQCSCITLLYTYILSLDISVGDYIIMTDCYEAECDLNYFCESGSTKDLVD